MKHLAILLLFFFCSCSIKESEKTKVIAFDETTETQAIIQTIEGETKAFFDGKYEEWSSHWSHDSMAMQAWNNSDGTADAAIGWHKINAQGKNWIETYYKNGKNIIHPDVKKEKPLVKFFNNSTAYLLWKQYNADSDKKFYRISQETRIMQKESGKWKILNVTAFWDTEKKIPADSLIVN